MKCLRQRGPHAARRSPCEELGRRCPSIATTIISPFLRTDSGQSLFFVPGFIDRVVAHRIRPLVVTFGSFAITANRRWSCAGTTITLGIRSTMEGNDG